MKKYIFTVGEVKKIMETYGLSNRQFSIETGVNRGDLSRFFRGLRKLSEQNAQKIYKFAKAKGFYDIKKKKTLLQKIFSFFKKIMFWPMKIFLYILLGCVLWVIFGICFVIGLEREEERNCISALRICENYTEYGACSRKYLDSVCKGVFDDK